jgi:probable phosphoglycerate mutase
MELVLVRHAEPEWVRDGLNVDNPPLTGRGHRQALWLAAQLSGEHFDEVLVSPLLRARQTAAPVLRALDRSEVVDHWLEEIRNPVWHGTPREKADAAFRDARRQPVHEQWRGIPGGEAVSDFVARVRLGCRMFLAERGVERLEGDFPVWRVDRPDRRILVVAHAGTNAVVVSYLLGLAPVPWEWERFVIGHTGVTRLETFETGGVHTFALSRLSSLEHLPEEERTR